jgi:hypothetical protein
MDSIERNRFLIEFAKASPSLNCLILNHSGSPERLQTNLTSIDLLSTAGKGSEIINYCLSYAGTQQVRVTNEFYRMRVEIEFTDASEVKFFILSNIFRKGLKALPVDEFISHSTLNEYGMLVPSPLQHFEYILIKYQFAGIEFPDRYQKYFTAMPPAMRAGIFRYLQEKYHFIFNSIEDLYKPKATTRLKIMIGLRGRSENSLIKMFFRTIAYFMFRFSGMFFKRQKSLLATAANKEHGVAAKSSSRQAAY